MLNFTSKHAWNDGMSPSFSWLLKIKSSFHYLVLSSHQHTQDYNSVDYLHFCSSVKMHSYCKISNISLFVKKAFVEHEEFVI